MGTRTVKQIHKQSVEEDNNMTKVTDDAKLLVVGLRAKAECED